jgi:gamma-glutamyltranspeptidase
VRIESRLDSSLQSALTSRGHKLTTVGNMGVSQAIWYDKETGQFLGVHDPRVPGKAAGP